HQGAATALAVDLPDKVEVRRVEARALPVAGTAPRLKQWHVWNNAKKRQLQLEFQAPVTTGVQVFFELLSTEPLRPSVTLSLPAPEGAASGDCLLAYRAPGLRATLAEYRRLTGVDTKVFAGKWQGAAADDP